MTEDNRVVDLPALLASILMQIATADGDSMHFEQNVFLANFRNRKFPKLDRVRLL